MSDRPGEAQAPAKPVCRICGDQIMRRTNVARPGEPDQGPDDPRPWLHVHGMDYEAGGFAPHNAEPAEVTL